MRNYFFLALLLLTTATGSWGQHNKKLLRHTPSDVMMVLNANHDHLRKKVAINDIKALPMVEKGFQLLKNTARQDSTWLIDLWEDPNNFGLDIENGLLCFLESGDERFGVRMKSGGVMLPLSSKGKFQSLLKLVTSEHYKELVEKGKGYRFIVIKQAVLAWNGKFALIMGGAMEDYELVEHLDEIMRMKKKNSLLANEDFLAQTSDEADYTFWLDVAQNIRAMDDNVDLFRVIAGKSAADALSDVYSSVSSAKITTTQNFEAGGAITKTQRTSEEKMQKFFSKIYNERLPNEIFDFVEDDELIGIAGGALNIPYVAELVAEQREVFFDSLYIGLKKALAEEKADTSSLVANLKETYNAADTLSWEERSALWDSIQVLKDSIAEQEVPLVDDYIDSTIAAYGFERADVWNVFTGNLLIVANGTYELVDTFQTYDYVENDDGEFIYAEVEKTELIKRPLIRAIASTGTPDKIRFLLNKLDSTGLVTKESHFYTNTIGKYQVYITISPNNYLITSNDKEYIESLPENNWKVEHPVNQKILHLSQQSSTFALLDLNRLIETLDLKEDDKKYAEVIKDYISAIQVSSKMAGSTPQKLTTEAEIQFSDPGKNSLLQLFELANAYYLLFTGGK